MRFSKSSAAAIAASIPAVAAQTFTSCNPLNETCPADTGLTASTYTADFTKGSSAAASWSLADGTTLNYGSGGAEFTISKPGEAPTVSSDFYILFGRVDVTMKASPGTGIISSIVLESDDLDEIDWEFFGTNTAQVETNFFGKGNTTTYNRATYYSVATPQNTYHTYSVDWNQERLEFIIDGVTVRTIPYDDPLTVGGKNYPQTPMRLKLGSWAAGGPGEPEGTVTWAGGNTDFSQAPFTMYVQSINIQNYNPAATYTYGDMSGSWESIEINDKGSSSGASSAVSGTTTASGKSSAATTAPTSMVSVGALTNAAGLVAPTTVTGSAYSTNTQSASALNSAIAAANTTVSTATVAHSTSTPSSSLPAGNSGATTKVMTGSSLLSIALAFFML